MVHSRRFCVEVGVLIVAAFSLWGELAYGEADSTPELCYDRPAKQWTEALPVGNGRLGCMVFGGVDEARYQFNEDTLWTGAPHDYAHPGAAKYLPRIRQLLFEGRQHDAEELAQQEFMSIPLHQCAYQPFGDVTLRFQNHGQAKGYQRCLDLRTATAVTSYRIGDVQFTRQTIASYPDQVLVIHLACSRPSHLNFDATLTSPHPDSQVSPHDSTTLVLTGKVGNTKTHEGDLVKGKMRFAAYLRISSPDGTIEASQKGISVSGASQATLLLTAATNFVNFRDLSGDAVARSRKQMESIHKSWEAIHRDQVKDHQNLYNRISLRPRPIRFASAADGQTNSSVRGPERSGARDAAIQLR